MRISYWSSDVCSSDLATLEYYWKSGFVAVAGYYRDITDRVISAPSLEFIDGIGYNINRPRNVGEAKLKGVEVSGQTFFDFLPGRSEEHTSELQSLTRNSYAGFCLKKKTNKILIKK